MLINNDKLKGRMVAEIGHLKKIFSCYQCWGFGSNGPENRFKNDSLQKLSVVSQILQYLRRLKKVRKNAVLGLQMSTA